MALGGVTAAIVGELVDGLAVGELVASVMPTGRAGRSGAAPEVVVRPTVECPPTGGAGRVGGGLDPPAGPRSGPSASGAAGRMPAKTAAGRLRRAGGRGRVGGDRRRVRRIGRDGPVGPAADLVELPELAGHIVGDG